ncbi:hypothetical protein [Burkholderia ubonensis]|uniref:Uncharacterized protein n=1 Tax=Burkholderia ubonensis subsp. mesacidophila TaxID=265293 RepID=A0A2A4FAD2_9BURK|nr:hypothetical protein [Burkholderia ubonensis]PCE30341.1 hypothetical protein BZL54_21865 [Burkholderia ubonensis subsp. mesacidophila]
MATFAQTPAPQFVQLSGGPILQEKSRKLLETDARHGKVQSLIIPKELQRVLRSSSSVAFPTEHSKVIDGREFAMVVVNQPSSDNPMGYCGAGEEGTLYVLRLHHGKAEVAFSTLVQSCLKNVDLFTDSGNKSPYLAIAWDEKVEGIQIHWMNYERPAPLTRTYHYQGGTFVMDQDPPA